MSRKFRFLVAVAVAAPAVVATWVAPGGAAADRPRADHWAAPVRVATSGVLQDAAMSAGGAVVSWTDGRSVSVGYRAADGAWEVASIGAGTRPRVAVNDAGVAVVAWQRWVGGIPRVFVAQRPPTGDWTTPTSSPVPARVPVTSVRPDGTVWVVALGWRAAAPENAAVLAFSLTPDWSAARQLSRTPLEVTPALRRSLSVATTPEGRLVATWKCGRFACVKVPGAGSEWTSPAPRGVVALSVSPRSTVFVATRFNIDEVEPGLVYGVGWSVPGRVSGTTIDTGARDRGVASWLVAGNGPLWVTAKRTFNWGPVRALTQHAHGLGGATLVNLKTRLAYWRTDTDRLRIERQVRRDWRLERVIGRSVEEAELVSNHTGGALLVWSSGGSAPGVYAATR